MSPLPDGRYLIQADLESVTVGANPGPGIPGAGSRVIAGGVNTVWYIKHGEVDDIYTIDLEGGGRALIDQNQDLWVNGSIPPGPPDWKIVRVKDKLYTITYVGNKAAWNLPNPNPGTQVDLKPLDDPVQPNQLWKFSRLTEE